VGDIWLNGSTPNYRNVADVLDDVVPLKVYPGWEWNSRSSGGFSQLLVIYNHHTASNTTPANDVNYCMTGPDNPIANGLLDRTGLLHLYAGGASNHAGKGGGSDSRPPWQSSKGTVPEDAGNSNGFGLEIANAGTGEAYPASQQDSAVKINVALSQAYGLVPATDSLSHWEWTDRKCDPTGPSRFCDGNHDGCNNACRWNMDLFRAEVASLMGGQPGPTPIPGGTFVLHLLSVKDVNAKFVGMIDSKGLGHTVSWVRDQAEYDLYERLGATKRELGMGDLKGLWLVGSLPTGDTLHQWTGSEFHAA